MSDAIFNDSAPLGQQASAALSALTNGLNWKAELKGTGDSKEKFLQALVVMASATVRDNARLRNQLAEQQRRTKDSFALMQRQLQAITAELTEIRRSAASLRGTVAASGPGDPRSMPVMSALDISSPIPEQDGSSSPMPSGAGGNYKAPGLAASGVETKKTTSPIRLQALQRGQEELKTITRRLLRALSSNSLAKLGSVIEPGGFLELVDKTPAFKELADSAGGFNALRIGGLKALVRMAIDSKAGAFSEVRQMCTPLLSGLSDECFSASSTYDSFSSNVFYSHQAKFSSSAANGWMCGRDDWAGCYLEIDLQSPKAIVAIETRRAHPNFTTEKFDLLVSSDGSEWRKAGTFTSPYGSVAARVEPPVLAARYVRVLPKGFRVTPSLRVEIYGFGAFEAFSQASGGPESFLKIAGGFSGLVSKAGGFNALLSCARGFDALVTAAGGFQALVVATGGVGKLLELTGGFDRLLEFSGGFDALAARAGGCLELIKIPGPKLLTFDQIKASANALIGQLPTSSITASSVYASSLDGVTYNPEQARFTSSSKNGWMCAETEWQSAYVQFDLGSACSVVAVETKSGHENYTCEKFELLVSSDEKTWESAGTFTSPFGKIAARLGNAVLSTRYVRVRPTGFRVRPTLKVEVYGWPSTE